LTITTPPPYLSPSSGDE